jgi:hypothetical protein
MGWAALSVRVITRRKLSVVGAVIVFVALTLAACTSSSAPVATSSSTSQPGAYRSTTTAPVTTTTTNVTSADQRRFVALARQGLRQPFEAVYRLVYGTGNRSVGQVREFRIWSEPAAGSRRWGYFVYETQAGSRTFEFILNGRGIFECLRAASQGAWRCVGPLSGASIGQTMKVEGYRLPMYLIEGGFNPGFALSHRVVLSRRVWCLQTGNTLCITKSGQLALAAPTIVTFAQRLKLVSLAPISSKLDLLPPATPTPWKHYGIPSLCDTSLCQPPGLN